MKIFSRRAVVCLVLVGGLVVLSFIGFSSLSNADFPVYNGKSVDEWFFGSRGHPADPATFLQAEVVFHEMQTNAVPFLLSQAQLPDSALNRFYGQLHGRLPKLLRRCLPDPLAASDVRACAALHLVRLPARHLTDYRHEFMGIVPGIDDDSTRFSLYGRAKELVLATDGATNQTGYFVALLDDPYLPIRLDAAVALATLDPMITNGIPVLRSATQESPSEQRMNSLPSTRGVPFFEIQSGAREALRRVEARLEEPIEGEVEESDI